MNFIGGGTLLQWLADVGECKMKENLTCAYIPDSGGITERILMCVYHMCHLLWVMGHCGDLEHGLVSGTDVSLID